MLTLKQNIEAVLDSCFSETKDDIKQVALVSIMRLIERAEQTEPNCDTCRYLGNIDDACANCQHKELYTEQTERSE